MYVCMCVCMNMGFRFVRDYMRYKDDIQCAGTELVNMVSAP